MGSKLTISVRSSRNSTEIKCKYSCRPTNGTKCSAIKNSLNFRVGSWVVTVLTIYLKALIYYMLWVSINNKEACRTLKNFIFHYNPFSFINLGKCLATNIWSAQENYVTEIIIIL